MISRGFNYVEQAYEPRLPLSRTNGMLDRCSERWENIPTIQLNTKTGWWGNAVSDVKIGGLFADNQEQPILADGEYLKTLAAYAQNDLEYFKSGEIAESVQVQVTNPTLDALNVEITIKPIKPKFSIVPYREYNAPEVVKFWLSTLGGSPLMKNTLGNSSTVLSNLGGLSV